ncbi:MAG TPA: nuclear transport factor 2 family protein [Alphaproteobacteria bacterium]|nr:nuclear transport factor 2 family protein [Alphaproteobacteria bacterium]
MSKPTELIDRYIAVWNETDPARRRELIALTWTETAHYVDPLMEGDGPAGIDAMVAGVQERFPDHRFRLAGEVDAHHDRVRFGWELAPEGGEPLVAGIDFGVIAADGRLQTITGFLDLVPGQG